MGGGVWSSYSVSVGTSEAKSPIARTTRPVLSHTFSC